MIKDSRIRHLASVTCILYKQSVLPLPLNVRVNRFCNGLLEAMRVSLIPPWVIKRSCT